MHVLAPSNNKISMFSSKYVPNVMLVDKCTQYIPKLLDYNLESDSIWRVSIRIRLLDSAFLTVQLSL